MTTDDGPSQSMWPPGSLEDSAVDDDVDEWSRHRASSTLRRRRAVTWSIVLAVIVATASTSLFTHSTPSTSTLQLFSLRYGTPADARAIAQRVMKSLVTVTIYGQSGGNGLSGFATGMVLTSNGMILTNNHVVDGSTRLVVRDVGNGRSYTARVVGYDTAEDVAVIDAEGASGLAAITPGVNAPIFAGLGVVTVGNAQNELHYSGGRVIAQGLVTVVGPLPHFAFERLTSLIETTAIIAPGDSGGALVTASGQVIGMLTAAPETSHAAYLEAQPSAPSYAISIATALSIVSDIVHGEASSVIHIGLPSGGGPPR